MDCWRGVVTHIILLSLQPSYLAVRYWLDSNSFATRSLPATTIHVVTWIYILTRVTMPFLTSPMRRLPGAPGQRIIFGNFQPGSTSPLDFLDELVEMDHPLVVAWGPFYLFCEIIPTKPEVLMEILNARSYDWEKPAITKKALKGIAGDGLLNVEGAEHKAMRKLVAGSFTGHTVRQLVPLFYGKGQALVDSMLHHVRDSGDDAFDPSNLISRATLDIIGEAGMGMSFDTLGKNEMILPKLYETIIHPPQWLIFASALLPAWFLSLLIGTPGPKLVADQRRLREEVRLLVQQKKEDMQDASADDSKDLIAQIIINGGTEVSDEYLVNQMLTFLAAGHETTASAICWAIFLLSRHLEIQDRLREEVDAHLSNISPEEINATHFDKLMYLDAVCNEVLRLYPPAPLTSRTNTHPTSLASQLIPKHTLISLPLYSINRTENLWGPSAKIFDPDRWLTGEKASTGGAASQYSFMSFLYGPRSCIGQGFARYEMKAILAALVLGMTFEDAMPERRIEVEGFLTIRPKDLRVKVMPVKR
jgi:cytochrome P450